MRLIGVARLGRDAELRFTQSGTPVASLSLAFNYGMKDQQTGNKPTQWVDASLWGKPAEALAEYLVKGQQVFVDCDDVHIETYQGKNGQGHKLVARVQAIELVGGRPEGQQQGGGQQRQQPAQPAQQRQAPAPAQRPAAAPPADDDLDDVPF